MPSCKRNLSFNSKPPSVWPQNEMTSSLDLFFCCSVRVCTHHRPLPPPQPHFISNLSHTVLLASQHWVQGSPSDSSHSAVQSDGDNQVDRFLFQAASSVTSFECLIRAMVVVHYRARSNDGDRISCQGSRQDLTSQSVSGSV